MADRAFANGININYELEGPDGAPVVTMSHSLAANLGMWKPQVPALVNDYRVLRYDTRGHGGTDAPEGAYSFELLARDVVALLAALGIEKTHFVGLSMGGMIGQTLALDHPEVLESVVLCDTASGRGPQTEEMWNETWRQRIEAALADGLEPNVETTIERWFSDGFVSDNGDIIDDVRTMIRTTTVAGFVGCCHAISKLDLTERLNAITTPTLIVVGEDDPGTPVAVAQVIHEEIADSGLVILPTARHLSNMEQAELFNRALTGFLAKR